METLVKFIRCTCQYQHKRSIAMTACNFRRKKPPIRDMSKRNLQGEALAERLRLREEDIERQRPYKEVLAKVIHRFELELEEEEAIKRSSQGELMKREMAEREQAIKNLTIIAKSNEDLKRQREIELLIKEDEMKRTEEEKLHIKLKEKEELQEQNRQLVLKVIAASKDFVTQENLDEKVDELLSHETYFNYAIDPNGKKIHSNKPPGNLENWKGPSPSAYVMGGIKPGSSQWNFIFRNQKSDKSEKLKRN